MPSPKDSFDFGRRKQPACEAIAVVLARTVNRALRTVLEGSGYWVRHRSVLPYGLDYQHDIERLSRAFDIPVNVIFDIGANVGQSSSAALLKFPSATIFAFEPHSPAFAVLTNRIRSPRFKAFNLALSDRNGDAQFFEYGPLATSNSMVENSQYAARAKHPAKVGNIRCETLDGFCRRLGIAQIDLLKVDTEGHDLAVLRGAKQMLAEAKIRFVYVEFNTILPKPGTEGGALLPMSAMLEPLGFHFVATYPEYMITTGELFITANALFAYSPSPSGPRKVDDLG